jgi:hypothetical protein
MYYGGVTFFGGVYLGLPYYTEYTSVDQVMLTKVHLKYSTDSNSEQLKNGII